MGSCKSCFCRTWVRELIFTLFPFATIVIILLILIDWQFQQYTHAKHLLIKHSVPPLIDSVKDFFDSRIVEAEYVRSVIENGQWRDPSDVHELAKHLVPMGLQYTPFDNRAKTFNIYHDTEEYISVESLQNGNVLISHLETSLSTTAASSDPTGTIPVASGLSVRAMNISSGDHVMCPISSDQLSTKDDRLNLQMLGWFPVSQIERHQLTPQTMAWLSEGLILKEKVVGVRFAVNWTSIGNFEDYDEEIVRTSLFFLTFRVERLNSLLRNLSLAGDTSTWADPLKPVHVVIFNRNTLSMLAYNLMQTSTGLRQNMNDYPAFSAFVAVPIPNEDKTYNLGSYTYSVRVLQSILSVFQWKATTTSGSTATSPPPSVNGSSTSNSTEAAEGADKNDLWAIDSGWRLLVMTPSGSSTITVAHATRIVTQLNLFFAQQETIGKMLQSAIQSRLLVGMEGTLPQLEKFILPKLVANPDIFSIIHVPLPQDATEEAQMFLRSEKNSSIVQSRVYTISKQHFVRTAYVIYSPRPSTVFAPFQTSANSVEFVSNVASSTSEHSWLLTAMQVSSHHQEVFQYFLPDLTRQLLSLVLKAKWPRSSSCPGRNGKGLGPTYSYIRLSYRVNDLIWNLKQITRDVSEGSHIALVTDSGLLIVTQDTFGNLQSSFGLDIWNLAGFSEFGKENFLTLKARVGKPCQANTTKSTWDTCDAHNNLTLSASIKIGSFTYDVAKVEDYDGNNFWLILKFPAQFISSTTVYDKANMFGAVAFSLLFLIGGVAYVVYQASSYMDLKTLMKTIANGDPEAIDPAKVSFSSTLELREMEENVMTLRQAMIEYKAFLPNPIARSMLRVNSSPSSPSAKFEYRPVASHHQQDAHIDIYASNEPHPDDDGGMRRREVDDDGFSNIALPSQHKTSHVTPIKPRFPHEGEIYAIEMKTIEPSLASSSSSPMGGAGGTTASSYEEVVMVREPGLTPHPVVLLTCHLMDTAGDLSFVGNHSPAQFNVSISKVVELFLNVVQDRYHGTPLELTTRTFTAFWMERQFTPVAHNAAVAATSVAVQFDTLIENWVTRKLAPPFQLILTVVQGEAKMGSVGGVTENLNFVLGGAEILRQEYKLYQNGVKLLRRYNEHVEVGLGTTRVKYFETSSLVIVDSTVAERTKDRVFCVPFYILQEGASSKEGRREEKVESRQENVQREEEEEKQENILSDDGCSLPNFFLSIGYDLKDSEGAKEKVAVVEEYRACVQAIQSGGAQRELVLKQIENLEKSNGESRGAGGNMGRTAASVPKVLLRMLKEQLLQTN